jgi:hypothetical protein
MRQMRPGEPQEKRRWQQEDLQAMLPGAQQM